MIQEALLVEEVHFSRFGAQAKIGRRVRAVETLSRVPAGTEGTIIRADRAGGGYDVAVRWDVFGRNRPVVAWYRHDEYDRYLEEIRSARPSATYRSAARG